MSKQQSMQKRWSWIMGGMTLVVSLFFPHLWGTARVSGFFWQLSYIWQLSYFSLIDRLILFFPLCALTASMIWCWSRQMNQRPTVIRALVVVLEATVLALLATAVFSVVVFIITAPGNGWGMALTIFNTMWAGLAFLAFLPCLLIAAAVLASFQRKNQAA